MVQVRKRKGLSNLAVKRARIRELSGLKGVSDSALECILRKAGLGVSRGNIIHAVKRSYEAEFRKYGAELALPMANGEDDFIWKIARLDLIIPYFAVETLFFRVALERAFNSSGRDLTLVVYLDEYTAGNPLANDTRRKAWGIYVGVLEVGLLIALI